MNKIFVPFLPPWVETGLQPAFYDKESGTVLQQTARMYNKVNCLIRNFNQLSKETKETVEEYIAKFTELKDFVDNYFDNLDVQEEINNKLDAMAEAGTLQEIITTYIQSNVAWTFDTVADMKQATNLTNGSYAQTLGHDSISDKKGGLYKITNIEDQSVTQETLPDGLYATLIQNYPEYVFDKTFIVISGNVSGQTFQDKYVYLDECNISECNFINCVITGKCTCNGSHGLILDNNSTAYRIRIDNASPLSVIYGITLRGTNTKVIECSFGSFYEAITASGRNMLIDNCVFDDALGTEPNYVVNIKVTKIRDSIHDNVFSVSYPQDLLITNCAFLNKATDHIEFFTGGRNLRVTNCYFKNDNTTYISSKSYSYERTMGYNTEDDYTKCVLIESCSFIRETYGDAVHFIKHITDASDNFGESDININRCYFENCLITLNGAENVVISNNKVKNSGNNVWVDYNVETVVITERNALTIENNNVSGGRFISYNGLYTLNIHNNVVRCDKNVIVQTSSDSTFNKVKLFSSNNTYITSDSTLYSILFYQLYGTLISNNDISNIRTITKIEYGASNVFINNIIINGGSYIINGSNNDVIGSVNYLIPTGNTINQTANMGAGSNLTFTHTSLV